MGNLPSRDTYLTQVLNDCMTGASPYTRTMRTHRAYPLLLGIAGALVLLTGTAAAQEATYTVTFEEVTSNCDKQAALSLGKGPLRITRQGENVQIYIPAAGVPVLRGTQRKGGKLKGAAKEDGAGGIRKRYTASGRADDGQIQILFIAELFRGDTSVCSQTWNVTGSQK